MLNLKYNLHDNKIKGKIFYRALSVVPVTLHFYSLADLFVVHLLIDIKRKTIISNIINIRSATKQIRNYVL